ncbi:hypothetical protein EPO17_03575 [Patescibacteria group bacterium]|nr:MAG: hypothetical protein EPO17_03575 [Patescibacteria group bacterium]
MTTNEFQSTIGPFLGLIGIVIILDLIFSDRMLSRNAFIRRGISAVMVITIGAYLMVHSQ